MNNSDYKDEYIMKDNTVQFQYVFFAYSPMAQVTE